MKMSMRACFLPLAALLLPVLVQAQSIYKCQDSNGRTLTSDRPIPECADRAVQLLGKDGLVRKEIPAPLSVEEKRKIAQQAEKQKADAAAADEKSRADRAITTRFRSEADIELARKRAVDPVEQQIRRDSTALAGAEERLAKAQAEVDAHKGKMLPAAIRQRRDDEDLAVKERKRSLKAREEEKAQINAKYTDTMSRYREINAASAK
jgi:hypothetical protein